jgi:hypothetical protein
MKNRLIPFIILTLLSLLAGYISGSNIYYIFFLSMVFVALLALLSLLISYWQLNYSQKVFPKNGVKGQTVELDIQIHNEHAFPLPLVEIEYDLPDESLNLYKNKKSFGVSPKNKKSIKKEVYCRYMGKWLVGISKIKIFDIFGLFHLTIDFYKNANYHNLTLLIKPRVVNLDYLPLPKKESSTTQNPIQKITSDTAEMRDIRKYEPGDILKKIHWKASISKQELMVKNYSLSLDSDNLIYIDCSSHGLSGIKRIELEDMIAECATAVSNHLLKSFFPTKLVITGKERLEFFGRSPEDFMPMYDGISNINFDYSFSFFELFANEIFSSASINSIFLVTHSLDEKAFDSLFYLKQAGISITFILVNDSEKEHSQKTKKIISELVSAGIVIIHISPNDDLNLCIKEQAHEKKAV